MSSPSSAGNTVHAHMCLHLCTSTCKRMKLFLSCTVHQIQLKMNGKTILRVNTIKLKKTGINHYHLGFGSGFLDSTPKS